MAPNYLKLNVGDNTRSSKMSAVGTEPVLRHVYNHLLRNTVVLEYLPNLNESEVRVVDALKRVTEEFRHTTGLQMCDLVSKFDISLEAVDSLFFGVCNELFSEGITWSRISALLIFSSELTLQCLSTGLPEYVVENVLDCLLKFTLENLQRWIDDHGSWEGLIEFASEKKQADNEVSSGWARRALYSTVKVLGTLAYFANLADCSDNFVMNAE